MYSLAHSSSEQIQSPHLRKQSYPDYLTKQKKVLKVKRCDSLINIILKQSKGNPLIFIPLSLLIFASICSHFVVY